MSQAVSLSVGLPTYNGAKFIAEAVQSILDQSFADFELVVVDDGSSDGTPDIIRSFIDPRVRLFCNPQRLGIPGNWNRCLALAQGNYLCLFHQDDVMLPDNLRRKMEVLQADPAIALVHSTAELIVENATPPISADWMEHAAEDWIRDGREYCHTLLLRGNRICAPAVVARRQTLLDVGGFDADLGFACDYEMWMKVCMHGRVAFLHQPLVRYRWHGKNASHAYRFERGVDEMQTAGRRALRYYQERTGAHDEGQLLGEAMTEIIQARRWAAEVEQGRVWLEAQRANWQAMAEERERVIEQQRAWIANLEKGKAWSEEQQKNWQRVAEEREQMTREQQARIAELEAWMAELEKGKNWLEEQWTNWQRTAKERERIIAQQQAWIGELETSKAWLENEWRAWRESAWGRLGSRLGMVKPTTLSAPDANPEAQR